MIEYDQIAALLDAMRRWDAQNVLICSDPHGWGPLTVDLYTDDEADTPLLRARITTDGYVRESVTA